MLVFSVHYFPLEHTAKPPRAAPAAGQKFGGPSGLISKNSPFWSQLTFSRSDASVADASALTLTFFVMLATLMLTWGVVMMHLTWGSILV